MGLAMTARAPLPDGFPELDLEQWGAVHDNLFKNPQFQVFEPALAAEPPSIEKGTWRLNPDGTMETTWHLRPNIKWHDSQPFTSADLLPIAQSRKGLANP